MGEIQILNATDYAALRREVGRLLEAESRGRGDAERARVRRYWEVGERIEAVLAGRGRAAYGEVLLGRLAVDLDLRRRQLYEMLRLRRLFPIVPTSAQLGWSHYRVLLGVGARRARSFYVAQAQRRGWSVRQLELHVQQGLFAQVESGGATALPELPRGRLYTYRLLETSRGPRLDLGFRVRAQLASIDLGDAQTGQVVETVRKDGGDGYRAAPVDLPPEETYIYAGSVERVVDGDTLVMSVDLGFGVELEQTIRLRGIDAPELPTERGVAAREHVVAALATAPRVVVATRYPDRYGRYLGDVWYHPGWRDGARIAAHGRLLNGELVEAGLAARYRR